MEGIPRWKFTYKYRI